jgi:hypothetical protein
MKQLIKLILKEEVSNGQEKFQRKVISLLSKEGFKGSTDYRVIIQFINHHLGIKGKEAFELFQLFKDNWRTYDNSDDLIRSDISKKKVKTANSRGRELVINRIPFKGNNTHAEYTNGVYVVYSYDWYPVFVYKDGQWFENETRYSMSTAKQMSQLRPYGDGEIISISKDSLWDKIKN